MQNPYKVFHSTSESFRKSVHVVFVRPEQGANIGSAVRALSNMGINGDFRIVGSPSIIDERARATSVHAADRLEKIQYFENLESALAFQAKPLRLTIAATARVGSPNRPHPLWVRPAMQRAMGRLQAGEITELVLVFGSESDGLSNAEVDLCDWVVTIPSCDTYRSLNLAQALLVFCYEANLCLMPEWNAFEPARPSQRDRIVTHIVRLAEEVGFVLPGDPYKMKPRLEEILSFLPRHIPEAKTLHGLLDQIIRTVRKGEVDYKGRYRRVALEKIEVQRMEQQDGK